MNAGCTGIAWATSPAALVVAMALGFHSATARASEPQRVTVVAVPNAAEEQRSANLLMNIIGREELDAYGDTNVLDVLARVSGVSIEGDQPRLRGLGGGYTLILINGEPAPPGFSLDSLAPGDIERIEVIKGPSAEFGGVAGSINVILRRALPRQQQEIRAQLGHRVHDGQGNVAWVAGWREGDLSGQINLSAYSWVDGNEGFNERSSRDTLGGLRQSSTQSKAWWRGGGLRAAPNIEWKLSTQESLSWQAFAQNQRSRSRSERETLVLQGAAPAAPFEQGHNRGQNSQWRSQWQWLRKSTNGQRMEWRLGVQAQVQDTDNHAAGQDVAGSQTVDRRHLAQWRSERAWVSGRLRLPLGDTQTLSLGADAERQGREELAREFSFGQEREGGSWGRLFGARLHKATLFAQHEWQISQRTAWMLGLRLETAHSQTRAGSGNEGSAGILTPDAQAVASAARRWQAAMPMLNLRHALDAKGGQVLRLGLSSSIRVPELTLLMPRYALNGSYARDVLNTPLAADTAGNPALQPESAQGVELAFERQIGSGSSVSVGLFTRRIDGLIRRRIGLETVVEASVPRWVSRPVNFGRAYSTGLEFEARGRAEDLLGIGAGQGFRMRGSLSLYRSSVEQVDDPDARLEGQPPWSASFGVEQRLPNSAFSWGANLLLTPAFATAQTDRQRIWRSAARQLDLSLRWRFSAQTQLHLGIRNALPREASSTSSISDIDGFTANSRQSRMSNTQINLSFTHRLVMAGS